MTSETTPESRTTTYTNDLVAANYCASAAYSSLGDLAATADANGNHICCYYDSLHRLDDVGNNHQSTSNPCLRFRYDQSDGILGAKPAGVSTSNAVGRLTEAATDDCRWPITSVPAQLRAHDDDVLKIRFHSGLRINVYRR